MRIAIDLTALSSPRTGVDRYLRELVTHLATIDADNDYTLFVNAEDRRALQRDVGTRMRVIACCLRTRSLRLAFQQAVLPVVAALGGYDVVHAPSFFMPAWPPRARYLLSVHDMTFFSMPLVHNRLRRSHLFRRGVAASIRRADLINVPSDTTRADLLRWMPDVPSHRVRVTPYGVGRRFAPAPAAEIEAHRTRLRLPRRYILHVGTIEPRKNLVTLIESYRALVDAGRTSAHLVLAGARGWASEALLRQTQSGALGEGIHLLGYVADDDLPWLYRGAAMFVYPSLYEGFGFPPLEAMACGIPVIAAAGSAVEEHLRGAAALVPARDADALTSAIHRLEADDVWRAQLVRRGLERAATFRWDETARTVLECYRELARDRRHHDAVQR